MKIAPQRCLIHENCPQRVPRSPQSDPGRAPRVDTSQICIPGCAGLRPETPPSHPERAGCSGLRPQLHFLGPHRAHPPPSPRSYLPTTTFLLLTTFPSSDPHAGPLRGRRIHWACGHMRRPRGGASIDQESETESSNRPQNNSTSTQHQLNSN